MATRTKEEERLLDEKIALIQKKNEEILRRRQEIEEDKRMAEKHNAVVKLKPASTNSSRERTPALKPNNRSEDYPTRDFPEQSSRSVRTNRGRGAELYRRTSEDSNKVSGPPPDPKSFLYDEERDPVSKERENKLERKNRDELRSSRGGGSGGSDTREFSRSGRRGTPSGRRGGGRGRLGRNEEEDEWRAERKRVDEARIQRQRAADGRWRREWDNEKMEEPLEEPRFEPRRSPSDHPHHRHDHHDHEHVHHHRHDHHDHEHVHHHPHHRHDHHDHEHHHRHHHREGEQLSSPETPVYRPTRSPGVTRARGRGRGRLDPSELDMALDFLVEPPSLHKPPTGGFTLDAASPTSSSQDDLPMDPNRTVHCVGGTNFKISISNTSNFQSQPKPQRQVQGGRGRFRSQRNYSSQSDDDAPQDRAHGSRRQRQPRYPQSKPTQQENSGAKPVRDNTSKPDSTQNKPPLPPFKSERPPSSTELKDDDESWEDITTSGNESMGEDHSSVNSSPEKKGMKSTISRVVNTAIISQPIDEVFGGKDISSYPFDEYLKKCCSIEDSDNPHKALELELAPSLKNQNDLSIPGIIKIDGDKAEIDCTKIETNEQTNFGSDQENLEQNTNFPTENEDAVLRDLHATEQDTLDKTVNDSEEGVLSDLCDKINISETQKVEESVSESSEKNEDKPPNSTEEAATSCEVSENVKVGDDKNSLEGSKSELQDTKENSEPSTNPV